MKAVTARSAARPRSRLLGLWLELSSNWLDVCAAVAGLTGAWLLATNGEHAAWGWWAFLASNVA
jgi:hypothetical protein